MSVNLMFFVMLCVQCIMGFILQMKVNLCSRHSLGQTGIEQGLLLVSCNGSVQSAPPFVGGGLVHCRRRIENPVTPTPHVREHVGGDQSPQSVTPPLTEEYEKQYRVKARKAGYI